MQKMSSTRGQIFRTAVDGNHIRMTKPNERGSQFLNCKNFSSTVLMAVADADYCFVSVQVGAYGTSSDSDVFQISTLGNNTGEQQSEHSRPQSSAQ
jgi:hypothetical protein